MKNIYTPIDKIANMPIERVKLYCMNVRGDVLEITSSIICNSIDVPQIYYYKRIDNGQPIKHSERYYYNCRRTIATWNEVINYLIYHEVHMRNLYNKKTVNENRTETGRFTQDNKYAYKDTFPLELVMALKRINVTITEIAQILDVSRNTVYSRIKEYYIAEDFRIRNMRLNI